MKESIALVMSFNSERRYQASNAKIVPFFSGAQRNLVLRGDGMYVVNSVIAPIHLLHRYFHRIAGYISTSDSQPVCHSPVSTENEPHIAKYEYGAYINFVLQVKTTMGDLRPSVQRKLDRFALK